MEILNILCIIGSILSAIVIYAFTLGGYKQRFLGVEKKIVDIEESLEKTNIAVEDTNAKVSSISESLTGLKAALVQAGSIKEAFLTKGSSIRLTEEGKTALQESGFIELFQNEHDKIVNLIKEKNPSTKYDAQQYSINVIISLPNRDDINTNQLKSYSYKEGKALSDLLTAAGVYVSEEIIKELDIKE